MSVVIKKVDEDTISVDGKLVIRDMNGNWVGTNLNQTQADAVNNYVAALKA